MRQLYFQCFFPRPIYDEDEHSRNDGWECFLISKIMNKNNIKSKQRSFEDFIGTSFVLIDADLLLIWINNFQHCFSFHLASCLVLPAMLVISRGECIMIVSILTSVGMAIGVLIEFLFGRPTVSTTTSGNTSGGNKKGSGARVWIKNKLKALSHLLGKLADKSKQ